MSKESVIAIIIGLFVGLLAALAILFGPELLRNLDIKLPFQKDSKETQVRLDEGLDSTETNGLSNQELVIETPVDGAVFVQSSSDILIKGKSEPGAKVVGLSLANEAQTTTNNDGVFELELELLEGKNAIQIASYNDITESVQLTIYYAKD